MTVYVHLLLGNKDMTIQLSRWPLTVGEGQRLRSYPTASTGSGRVSRSARKPATPMARIRTGRRRLIMWAFWNMQITHRNEKALL